MPLGQRWSAGDGSADSDVDVTGAELSADASVDSFMRPVERSGMD